MAQTFSQLNFGVMQHNSHKASEAVVMGENEANTLAARGHELIQRPFEGWPLSGGAFSAVYSSL